MQSKLLIEKYINLLGNQEVANPVHNFTVLAGSVKWGIKKYYGKHYKNYTPLPIVSMMKDGASISCFSFTHGRAATRDVFKAHWESSSFLDEFLEKQSHYASKVDQHYERITHEYVKNTRTEQLIKDLEKITDDELNTNCLGWWSMLLDREFCMELLKEVGSSITEERFEQIWDKATTPVHSSFDRRSRVFILNLLNQTQDWKLIAEKSQYVYAGFHGVDDISVVEKKLQEEYRQYDSEVKINEALQQIGTSSNSDLNEFNKWYEALSDQERKLVGFVQEAMKMRDGLRDYIGKYFAVVYRISDKFLDEANITRRFLPYCIFDELIKGPDYLKDHKDEIVKRELGIICLVDPEGNVELEYGHFEESKNIIQAYYFKQQGLDINKEITEIKGNIGSKGKARGIVKIIKDISNESSKMQEGNILVTGMTRPEFVPLMRMAAAIVTDEGGVTCHAAIVAREMKKPCVIGTKLATKVLKDGDMVEVDADNGTVRILKSV